MTDTIARDIHQERAELVNLLIEARGLLTVSNAQMGYAIEDCERGLPMQGRISAVEQHCKVQRFLDRGLFGDKGGK